jgi:hypothetical protein
MSDAERDRERLVDDYMARLRRSLRGVAPDVTEDIEREIAAHIEDAMTARGGATVGELLDVLDRLGPPEIFARDLGLYMMVDRGYREWSVPHMVRSTAFWALRTVVGALVVLAFGLLYLFAAGLVAAGAQRWMAPGMSLPLPQLLPGVPAPVLVGLGLAGLGAITVAVRWFIGQYVAAARPVALGGGDGDGGWAERASARIVTLALAGLALTLATGLAGGVYRLGPPEEMRLPDDYLATPLGLVSLAGLLLLLLSPVLGLLWTTVAERRDRPGGP